MDTSSLFWLTLPHSSSESWIEEIIGINKQLNEEIDVEPTASVAIKTQRKKGNCNYLASKVSSKLEEGDLKGAVRLACSEDSFADFSDTTHTALLLKHPSSPDSAIPPGSFANLYHYLF